MNQHLYEKGVIISGPMACGKTRNAEALRRKFNCTRIVDDWSIGEPVFDHAIHLTNEPVEMLNHHGYRRVVSFDEAMAAGKHIGEGRSNG